MPDKKAAVSAYINQVQGQLKTGHAQEHSYRPALEALFIALTQLRVVNEPKGSAHGRPDFIFLKGEVPIAWVEAKDLHVNLEKIEKSEQMARYFGYPNLILTNGLEFRFYKNGKKYGDGIILAQKHGDSIEQNAEVFNLFEHTITDFIAEPIDTIRSAENLAKIMGGKARRLRDNIIDMLDPAFTGNKGDIENVMQVLKSKLIHDLTIPQFADLYAQTLVYGLFVARYHDDTEENFTRMEARERIPASNHLLQQFFDHIAGANFVKKLSFIVDEVCDVFAHSKVKDLVHGLYQQMNFEGETHDPIIHFYEDFLKEYDPKLRMDRGVFYTPLPVVRYIVRSIDALLKEHFNLEDGLADRATIEWNRTIQGKKSKQTIDRVQLLDPAAGTGTFLNEVIRSVHTRFKGQEGSWPQYVEEHLIPRLHGFELMMASYTIAHLKLGMTLAETGVNKLKKRLRVFLTNSLEEAPPKDDTLFSFIGFQEAITEEAESADEVKRDYPIMVVLGNPPYSVSSQNASIEIGTDGKKRKTWIGKLIDDYKKDLNEKKLNLDDDYIKFIRFAHYLIEKNGQGIAAMITNNSFLDGITHRRMRQSLLETFDHIYVLDLHGNSKRKEKTPEGGIDKNVFDIQQGVGITLFVKTGSQKKIGTIHHTDLYGKQDEKYTWLDAHDASNTKWQKLETPEPNFFFVPKDLGRQNEFDNGIKLSELFPSWNSGIKTDRDSLFIDFDREELISRMKKLLSEDFDAQFKEEYRIEDSGSYKLTKIIRGKIFDDRYVSRFLYRPFDVRTIYYDPTIISRPAAEVMTQMQTETNLALLTCRQQAATGFAHVFCTSRITECCSVSNRTREITYAFPLYLYSDSSTISNKNRTANLNLELLRSKLERLKLKWTENSCGDAKDTCGPEDIFDYIYAILHNSTYRDRFKEFLKIDFPRVPFTSNKDLFWKLVKLGREIRELHLIKSLKLSKLITTFPITGSNTVEKIKYEKEKVWFNTEQYFDGIPNEAWEFPIGGYIPAQKWLKDRKGRELSSDDILHYQKMIVALAETGKLMKQIDEVIESNGGFPIK